MKIFSSNKSRALLIAALFGIGTVGVSGCDVDEGPVEEAGEGIDEAIEETEDAAEEAGQEIDEAVNEADDEI